MSVINDDWRKGQIAFNILWVALPSVADEIRGDMHIDPYHNDDNLDSFWSWLVDRVQPWKEQ